MAMSFLDMGITAAQISREESWNAASSRRKPDAVAPRPDDDATFSVTPNI